jgi:hypothetical protein
LQGDTTKNSAFYCTLKMQIPKLNIPLQNKIVKEFVATFSYSKFGSLLFICLDKGG